MARSDLPGSFEQLVLLGLLRLGAGAYGMTVRREIESRTSRAVSLGAVYATLDRLERKGWVSSRTETAAATPERGGRPRRFFRVEAAGQRALEGALAETDAMRAGLGAGPSAGLGAGPGAGPGARPATTLGGIA